MTPFRCTGHWGYSDDMPFAPLVSSLARRSYCGWPGRSSRDGCRSGIFGGAIGAVGVTVTVEKNGVVTTIIIDRPERKNAVDRKTAERLAEAFRAF